MPASINTIRRLDLGSVSLPDTHPRASEGSCPVFGFAIVNPEGVIVVDTGPREGHPVIDELYAPRVTPLLEALNAVSVDERDVIAIVNTHLHFDHCGQNNALPQAPIWVCEAEAAAAEAVGFTVPEWAAIDDERRRFSSDGEVIAAGVRLLHTPGHTPGHQSVAIDTDAGTELIVGQACYRCGEFDLGEPAPFDMHDAEWLEVGRQSVARLRSMGTAHQHFSHDPEIGTAATSPGAP